MKDREIRNLLSQQELIKVVEFLFEILYVVAAVFIVAALFILTFSFVVDDKCPQSDPNCDESFRMRKRIHGLLPIILSYGFLFVALISWYFLHYRKIQNNINGRTRNC